MEFTLFWFEVKISFLKSLKDLYHILLVFLEYVGVYYGIILISHTEPMHVGSQDIVNEDLEYSG
jgi:hypothetical protein